MGAGPVVQKVQPELCIPGHEVSGRANKNSGCANVENCIVSD